MKSLEMLTTKFFCRCTNIPYEGDILLPSREPLTQSKLIDFLTGDSSLYLQKTENR